MSNPLMINEVSTRCLAALSRCYKEGSHARAIHQMKEEIRQIARDVARWQFSGEAKARIFLKPMEEALVNHYGAQVGRRLYWDFVDAFWLQSWSVNPIPVLDSEPGTGFGAAV